MEIFRTLGVMAEPPDEHTVRLASLLELGAVPSAQEYADVFLMQVYPYASVYVGAEGMMGGDARDRVAGFWRALGEKPPAEPDHLAALLGLYATLVEAERESEAAGRARAAMLWEHLACWLPPWIDKLREIASPSYAAWGGLLAAALREEARRTPPLDRLPLHLREAPPMPGPGKQGESAAAGRVESGPTKTEGASEPDPAHGFVGALLAPVRSGVLLTRADIARMAADLGLAVRAGERAYALRALLSQDADGVACWLRAEASSWATRHEATAVIDPAMAAFWSARARRTGKIVAGMEAGVEPETRTAGLRAGGSITGNATRGGRG